MEAQPDRKNRVTTIKKRIGIMLVIVIFYPKGVVLFI